MSSRGGWVVRALTASEGVVQPTPGGHAGLFGVAVECGVGQLDAQGDIVDGHAQQVLEEHDTGLPPRDLGESPVPVSMKVSISRSVSARICGLSAFIRAGEK